MWGAVCVCLQAHCEAYEAIKKMPIGKDLQVRANLTQQAPELQSKELIYQGLFCIQHSCIQLKA